MALRFSALLVGCPLSPERLLVLISVRGWRMEIAISLLSGVMLTSGTRKIVTFFHAAVNVYARRI
jgi:hypothetical protein